MANVTSGSKNTVECYSDLISQILMFIDLYKQIISRYEFKNQLHT